MRNQPDGQRWRLWGGIPEAVSLISTQEDAVTKALGTAIAGMTLLRPDPQALGLTAPRGRLPQPLRQGSRVPGLESLDLCVDPSLGQGGDDRVIAGSNAACHHWSDQQKQQERHLADSNPTQQDATMESHDSSIRSTATRAMPGDSESRRTTRGHTPSRRSETPEMTCQRDRRMAARPVRTISPTDLAVRPGRLFRRDRGGGAGSLVAGGCDRLAP